MANTISKEKLEEMLKNHDQYVKLRDAGTRRDGDYSYEYLRLNLDGEDLSNIDLSEKNLKYAIITNSILYNSNFSRAILSCAKLSGSILSYSNFYNAQCINTDFSNTKLNNSIFIETLLFSANFTNSNVCYSNFVNARLNRANFTNSELEGTIFYNSSLVKTNFSGAKGLYVPMTCPSEGSFIGWKKVLLDIGYCQHDEKIVKLLIPKNAKRSSAASNKCRCEFAKVLEIQNIDGTNSGLSEIINKYSIGKIDTIYKVGEYVYPNSFDDNRWEECSNGIHFFIDRNSAVNYNIL